MRTVLIEWRNEFEYCIIFKQDDKTVSLVYTQSINAQSVNIGLFLQRGIVP